MLERSKKNVHSLIESYHTRFRKGLRTDSGTHNHQGDKDTYLAHAVATKSRCYFERLTFAFCRAGCAA